MKSYLVAFAIGVLVGVIYGLLRVRSPAPPVVALIGLLGMLVGEQLVPIARNLIAGTPPGASGTGGGAAGASHQAVDAHATAPNNPQRILRLS